MTIYKYPLRIDDTQFLKIPRGSRLLSVQMQNGVPCLWAVVDPSAPLELRTIAIYGTGNPLPERIGDFIGTVQMSPFVWHVFEVRS